MSFLDNLLKGGSGYEVRLTDGGASLQPVGDGDEQLEAFQEIAREVIRCEGQGYSVHLSHRTSDRAEDFIDSMLLKIGE